MILKNANVLLDDFRFHKTDLVLQNGKIASIGNAPQESGALDLEGRYVIPGLIDIHTHGAVGTDTMDADFDFGKWQKYLYSYGITTFFPTTVSESRGNLLAALLRLGKDDRVEGVNLEGPYLACSKRGAHAEQAIRPADLEEMEQFLKASAGKIKITTIAPETQGNLEFIRALKKRCNITVSAGHSIAGFDQAQESFAAGVTHLTHTFNAMNGLNHREPGLLGAALTSESVFCEVICDGIHLHPAIIQILYKQMTIDRMELISDSMAAAGLSDGDYHLSSLHVTVQDGVARTDSGAIAGSTKNLMQMTRTAVRFGIPMEEAVKMASNAPARAVGLAASRGSIIQGKAADLAVTDRNLNVLLTLKSGETVFTQMNA